MSIPLKKVQTNERIERLTKERTKEQTNERTNERTKNNIYFGLAHTLFNFVTFKIFVKEQLE